MLCLTRPSHHLRHAVLLVIAMAGLSASGCTKVVRERDLFHPQDRILAGVPKGARPIAIPRPDEANLVGWLIEADASVLTVVYFGGNGETVADSWPRLRWMSRAMNVNILAVDYRGYGASSGVPSLKICGEDAVALIDALRATEGYERSRVVVYGRSIGGGMAVFAAAHRLVDGLVLEAPPASCPEVVRSWNGQLNWFYRMLVTLEPDPALSEPSLQPIAMIGSIQCPLLIIHGDADTVIPQSQGRDLYERSGAIDKRFLPLPGVGHNDIALNAEPAQTALESIFAEITALGPVTQR